MMSFTTAVKLLRTGKGHPHEVAVVPVWIIGVPFKMCLDRFNPRICMLT
ncbi:MAG: hypothetical protein QG613_72 [Pseudomonadota bacterium]|nr:hypothetical protein [Pseudomonadota bacterium]